MGVLGVVVIWGYWVFKFLFFLYEVVLLRGIFWYFSKVRWFLFSSYFGFKVIDVEFYKVVDEDVGSVFWNFVSWDGNKWGVCSWFYFV